MGFHQKKRANSQLSGARSQTYQFIFQHWRGGGGNRFPFPLKDDAKLRNISERYRCFFRPSLEMLAGKGKEARIFFSCLLQMLQM